MPNIWRQFSRTSVCVADDLKTNKLGGKKGKNETKRRLLLFIFYFFILSLSPSLSPLQYHRPGHIKNVTPCCPPPKKKKIEVVNF